MHARWLGVWLCLLSGCWAGGNALAQAYPHKPIKFVVGYPPGGSGDFVTRTVGEAIAEELGQTAVIDNRPGAAGNLASEFVSKSAPDGYTLLVGSNPYINKALYKKLPYDIEKDFQPVSLLGNGPMVIAVNGNLPVNNIKELVAYAKKNPNKMNFGSSGNGSAPHLAGILFNSVAETDMLHIPFKGGADALQAVLGGHVDVLVDSSSWAPHVEAGKLNLLATWGEQRTSRFKDTPTLKDAGFNVVVDAPNGIGAPKGLDAAVSARLRQAFRVAVASAEFKQACDKIDAPVLYLDGPDYENYVAQVYKKETLLIDKLKLKELVKN